MRTVRAGHVRARRVHPGLPSRCQPPASSRLSSRLQCDRQCAILWSCRFSRTCRPIERAVVNCVRAERIASLLLEDEGGLRFTTKVTDRSIVDVLGTPDGWYLRSVSAVVEWTLEIDARSWGIKALTPRCRPSAWIVSSRSRSAKTSEERLVEYAFPLKQAAAHADDLKATALEMTGPKPLEVTAQSEWKTSDRGSGWAVTGIEIRHGTGQCVVQFG
jgi:hypothetical protein